MRGEGGARGEGGKQRSLLSVLSRQIILRVEQLFKAQPSLVEVTIPEVRGQDNLSSGSS